MRHRRVEHGGDADAGAEVSDRRRSQAAPRRRLTGGHRPPPCCDRRCRRIRQREEDVEVADRQKIVLARGKPVPCRRALALGAMPVAAAVIGDAAVAAVLARLDVAAEGGGYGRSGSPTSPSSGRGSDGRHGPRARRRHGNERYWQPPPATAAHRRRVRVRSRPFLIFGAKLPLAGIWKLV